MSDFSFDRFSLPHEIPDQLRPAPEQGSIADSLTGGEGPGVPDPLICDARPYDHGPYDLWACDGGASDEGAGDHGTAARLYHAACGGGGAVAGYASAGAPPPVSTHPSGSPAPDTASVPVPASAGAQGEHARHLSHPAGRGWIGVGRDIGLPGESAGESEWRFAAGGGDFVLRQAQDRPFGQAQALRQAQDHGVAGQAPALRQAQDHGVEGQAQDHGTAGQDHGHGVGSPGEGVRGGLAGLPFSPARRALFCDLLAGSGNVRAVCALIGVSAHTAYRARRRDALFAAAWDGAIVLSRDHAEAVLAARALEGVEDPVFYRGEAVAQRRRYDSRLLLAHLGRLDARCSAAGEAAAGQFDALLAQLGGGAEEPLPAREDWAEAQALTAGLDALRAQAARDWTDEEDEDEEPGDACGEDRADPVELARDQARADASAEWDARHAAACAWVDGNRDAVAAERGVVVGEAGLDEDGLDERGRDAAPDQGGRDAAPDLGGRDAAVPADLPYEVKGRISGADGGRRLFSLNPVTLCKPACWTASTGISWALTGRAPEQANALSHAYRTGRWV